MKSSNVLIPIEYPQKLNILIEFSIDLNELDKINTDLDDFWDDIVEYIKTPLFVNGYQILNGSKTYLNEDYTLISYTILLLGQPPFISLVNLISALSNLSYPKAFTIKTNDKYNSEKWEILYRNQI